MKYLGPTSHRRLNEAIAFVYLLAGFFVFISLASYHPFDPSANTATSLIGDAPGMTQPTNLTGHVGAVMSDLLLQGLGLGAYVIPILIWLLGWQWVRSRPFEAPRLQLIGTMLFVGSTCTALGLVPGWNPIAGVIPAGGLLGLLSAQFLVGLMNMTGAVIVTVAAWVLSVYLFTTFELAHLPKNLRVRLPEFGRFSGDEEPEVAPSRKAQRSTKARDEQADDEAASPVRLGPARPGLFARVFSRLTAGSYRHADRRTRKTCPGPPTRSMKKAIGTMPPRLGWKSAAGRKRSWRVVRFRRLRAPRKRRLHRQLWNSRRSWIRCRVLIGQRPLPPELPRRVMHRRLR